MIHSLILLAAGQVCVSPVVTTPVVTAGYAAPVVVKEIITPVAVPVLIPAYGAVYTPPAPAPAAPAAPSVAPQDLKAIADSLRAIDQRLRSLEAKPGVPPAAPAAPPAPAATPAAPAAQAKPADPFNPGAAPHALAIVQGKCAVCHSAETAAAKGGGLSLIEGGALAKLTDRQARKVMTTVYRGTMPPKSSGIPALTDEEVSVLVSILDK